ncbi:hypothetical protein DYBT9275_02105 [Dyadobacter sp. CECT 9275]|uniref:EcsC family protein n=1 Tax=Dyadobacter helix TaxID=2822344 RepID=A0A916NBM5_9BACT|nr:EcsC family protein [Dyadobacter sp. CECT 9275]CAG4998906.1 hypothetical protein DYBT9275_02105 [Dyadobacter sp. CECT 9275]
MTNYEEQAYKELLLWEKKMLRKPSAAGKLSKNIQDKINGWIPDKVHKTVTTAIKQMTRGVLFGAEFINSEPSLSTSLEEMEQEVLKKISFYRKAGAAEGGITGAGGFWFSLADFPLLLALKMKLLFEIASSYGFSVLDYRERIFIMHIFQLAFSSQQNRQKVFSQITNWEQNSKYLPDDIHQFDWKTFQQEYRDYIDLAKLAQLIPGIGAAVGLVVNYRLIDHLGKTAMNAYRMRLAEKGKFRLDQTPAMALFGTL